MKKIENKASKLKDAVLWIAVALTTAIAFIGTYYTNYPAAIIVLIWVVWLIVFFGLAFFTSTGQTVFAFSKEAKTELEKVVWPTRQETVQTTSIVMLMVAITGMILWGIDLTMMWVIGKITHLG